MSIRKGTAVAVAPEAFRDADPFTAYLVAGVHKDGTVDLSVRGGDPRQLVARRIRTKHLTILK